MIPRTAHISSQKFYCWIDGGGFMSSQNSYDSSMSYSNKDNSHSSFYQMIEDQLCTAGDGRRGVVPSTTHLSSQKIDFSTDRHDG